MGFPDPEMRKFLARGNVDSLVSALSPHIQAGLEIVSLDDNAFVLRYGGRETTGETSQMLKRTVAAANGLFLGEQ